MPWRSRSSSTGWYRPAGVFRSRASARRAQFRAPEPLRSVPDRRSVSRVTLLLRFLCGYPARQRVPFRGEIPHPGLPLQFLWTGRSLMPSGRDSGSSSASASAFCFEAGDEPFHPREIGMRWLQPELEGAKLGTGRLQLLSRGHGYLPHYRPPAAQDMAAADRGTGANASASASSRSTV